MAGIDRRRERAAATGTHGITARPCRVAADDLQLHHPAAFDEAGGGGRTTRGQAMSNRRIAILLAVSAMSTASVRAQEPASALPERLTLPILLRLVAERSPRLAVEQVAIDTAEAERITAGALPNPTVSYGRFTPSGGARTMFDGSQQQQATVDLPLLIGGQRGARIEAAEQGLLAARARVGLTGNELALRAADLFVGLQAAQEKASMLDESVAEIKRVVAIVSGRLDSGAASRYDLTRVEVELAGMNARLADARAELSDRSAGLAALLGASGWRPTAIGIPTPAGLSTSDAVRRSNRRLTWSCGAWWTRSLSAEPPLNGSGKMSASASPRSNRWPKTPIGLVAVPPWN